MSNFFLNIAARAVDNENAVRPRVAARFESSEPVAELAEINEEIGSRADATQIVRDSPQRRRGSGSSGFNAVVESRGQTALALSSTPSASPQPIDPDAVDALAANTPVQAGPEVNQVGGGEAPSAVSPAISHHVHNTDDVELPQQDKATVVAPDAPVQERIVVARLSAQATQPAAAARAIAPIATAPASRRPATEKPPRETSIARNTREMPAPAGALPSAETVVHVTIGRVELRVPSTAAPRKREQPPQTGTLAEYLQKHAAARTRS